ncbi:lamin tail domain-containing protein [Streptomyces sp. SDr-06]|uniref:lamin tail domain-containing protein n=1 Tax=Streptomyces sp. SDr-06 TaxID=2267702 RepID=UPI000DE85166|nr:lamin tail domain-containing protein [Streptomyces sp. SDr-06]RCH70249.1 lamin tail domain-containing protein [Streptomyces sp. SDr-06]
MSTLCAGLAGAPRSPVTFGAIQYDSPGKDDRSQRSLNAEWVTVTNTGRTSVSLKGWTLSDRGHHAYTFGTFTLGGRASVRVHTGIDHNTRTDVYQSRRASVWNNSGDTATLRDNHGRAVVTRSWGRH